MAKIAVPIAILAAALIVGIFNLMPAWEKFQNVRGEILHLEELAAELDDLVFTRDRLAEKIQQIPRADLERSERIIPKGPQGPEFLVSLEQMALNNTLDIARLDIGTIVQKTRVSNPDAALPPSPSVPAGIVSDLRVQIGVRGTYEQFKTFLRDLEEFIRITDINTLTFTTTTEETVDVTMQAKTYYQ